MAHIRSLVEQELELGAEPKPGIVHRQNTAEDDGLLTILFTSRNLDYRF